MLNINIKTNSNIAKTLPSINLSCKTSTDSWLTIPSLWTLMALVMAYFLYKSLHSYNKPGILFWEGLFVLPRILSNMQILDINRKYWQSVALINPFYCIVHLLCCIKSRLGSTWSKLMLLKTIYLAHNPLKWTSHPWLMITLHVI